MCDIEKRGAVSFPVSSLYLIRSEKKGALSLAKGYLAEHREGQVSFAPLGITNRIGTKSQPKLKPGYFAFLRLLRLEPHTRILR